MHKKISLLFAFLFIIIFTCSINILPSCSAPQNADYTYQGNNYLFEIDSSNQEHFYYIGSDNKKTGVFQSAGNFMLRDKNDTSVSSVTKVKSYRATDSSVEISYETTDNSVQNNTYRFYPDSIQVLSTISNTNANVSAANSFLVHSYTDAVATTEKRLSTNWVYPFSGDFPYRDFDSTVLIHALTDCRLYTFYRGENGKINDYFENLPDTAFPIRTSDNKVTQYALEYALVFEGKDSTPDSDASALFKSRQSDFSSIIMADTNSNDQSTVFTTPNVNFHIHIGNLKASSLPYQLQYTVYSYSGKRIDYSNQQRTLTANGTDNFSISLQNLSQGIYYIDYAVQSGDSSYRELFPFVILENRKSVHAPTSPFGLSGVHFGTYEPNNTTISLLGKLGVSNVRVGISCPEYIDSDNALLQRALKKISASGIRITGQFNLLNGWIFPSADNTAQYQAQLNSALSTLSPYLDSCELGNEPNMIHVSYNAHPSIEASMEHYLKSQFNPGYDIVKSYQLPLIAAGVQNSKSDWLNLMVRSSLYEKTDILSTHAYSYPHSPDHTSDVTMEHSFESALKRVKHFMEEHGEKTWYLSEFGIPTTPLSTAGSFSGTDLRTQSDYMIRAYILGLSYGADVLEGFSMYDQLNMVKSISPEDCEYHFGMFYDQDYHGRVLPKPMAASYGAMTRILTGYQSCREVPVSSKTVRAFQLELKNSPSPVTVAWSNKHPLSNDNYTGSRTPTLPWENQWKGSESVSIKAIDSSVPILVMDTMGNLKSYRDSRITISVSGSPVYIINGAAN